TSSGPSLYLQHHACAGEARFVADRKVMADDAAAAHELLEPRVKSEPGLARAILHRANAPQRHRIAEAGSHRLGKRFLRCKAVGEIVDRPDALEIRRPFDRRQHAPGEALAVALDEPRHPLRLDHVDADAVDHRGPAISAFISRTAWGRPTKTACATMACPMLSSRIPGTPAIAPTFS